TVAAQKIEIRGVIHVVEIRAFRSRIDLVETDNALGGDECAVQMAFVELVIFSQPCRDDFFQLKSHGQWSAIWTANATLRLPIPEGVERSKTETGFASAVS